jgi:hypothetical protein
VLGLEYGEGEDFFVDAVEGEGDADAVDTLIGDSDAGA